MPDKPTGGQQAERPRRSIFAEDVRAVLRKSKFAESMTTSIFESIAAKQEERILQLLGDLTKELDQNVNKIDQSFFETDEFQSLFRKTYETISKDHRREKLELANNLLVRAAIDSQPQAYEFDAFVLGLLEQLTVSHFACLFAVAAVAGSKSTGDITDFVRSSEVAQHLKGSATEVQPILDHLASLGLLFTQPGMARVGRANISMNIAFYLSETGNAVLARIKGVTLEST